MQAVPKATKYTVVDILAVSLVALSEGGALRNLGEVDQQVQRAGADTLKPNPTLQPRCQNVRILTFNAPLCIDVAWHR
jgi:hypothetical protein